MRRLILMRHAKSDWSYPGASDHDRPLNARGTRSAQALGAWLRDNGYLPDEVLCSTALRTRQTLAGLELPEGIPTKFIRALYLSDADEMLRVLKEATGSRVLMIAHNAGICEMANRLVDEPPAHDRFADYPTGATLVCDFETKDWKKIGWHEGQPVDFIVPRELP